MGNYEIQAKIDIKRHPEWDDNEKFTHLCKMQLKDIALKNESVSRKRNDIFKILEEHICNIVPLTWQNNPFFMDYVDTTNPYFTPSFEIDREERPWQHGLRAQRSIINEGVWTDARY